MSEQGVEKSCFVIGPIGEEGSPIRARSDKVLVHVITPVVRECGYAMPVRSDRIAEPGIITGQIIDHLLGDDLVVADLSERNANVFYELAVRHVVRKPVVQLMEVAGRLPFDLAPSRTVPLDHTDLDSAAEARKLLAGHIRAAERDPLKADNPISMAIDLNALRQSGVSVEVRVAEVIGLLREIQGSVQRMEGERTADRALDNAVRQLRGQILALQRRLWLAADGTAPSAALDDIDVQFAAVDGLIERVARIAGVELDTVSAMSRAAAQRGHARELAKIKREIMHEPDPEDGPVR